MTTILTMFVGIVAFLAYALYQRHKYFNKYKLKKETRKQRIERKEYDQRFNPKN